MASPPPYIPSGSRVIPGSSPSIRRNRRSELAIWWREIDRVLVALVLALMALGLIADTAASPAAARRLSTGAVHYDDFHFLWQQVRFLFVGVVAMFVVSLFPRELARRLGIMLGVAMLFALMLVPVAGVTINGARRWLNLGISLQPSEFMKPAFAIMLAWILSWRMKDPGLPVMVIATGLMGLVAMFLMMQPDFGSTMLFAGVWLVMMFLAGLSPRKIGALVGALVVGIVAAYVFYANARHRIDAFLGGGTAYDQVDLARHTLLAGGWTGTGLWLGQHKLGLPESQTDYIFSVIGEEFGLLACALVVLVYFAIVMRVLIRLVEEEDLFSVLAATGLVAQFGGQAFINILVNLDLFPSKGMTLPLISCGGSSTIALCLGLGFLLALTRRNPYLVRGPFTRTGGLRR